MMYQVIGLIGENELLFLFEEEEERGKIFPPLQKEE